MSKALAIAQQYLAAWNERDAAARRAKVAQLFTLEADYKDPLMKGAGHAGIDALIGGAQQNFPGYQFALHGTPDEHNDVIRFSWSLAAPGAEPIAQGTDIATVHADGRLSSVTGFIDYFAQ